MLSVRREVSPSLGIPAGRAAEIGQLSLVQELFPSSYARRPARLDFDLLASRVARLSKEEVRKLIRKSEDHRSTCPEAALHAALSAVASGRTVYMRLGS